MSDLASIARKGYEKAYSTLTPIWSVHAVNSTPVIAGGPDGNTVHKVDGQLKWWGIRPTAVRGVWRWWIRALLAGLLWEEGYTCDYRGIAKLEERLGLGTTSEASKVFLDIEIPDGITDPCQSEYCDIINKIKYIPRYRLLTVGHRNYMEILLKKQPIPPESIELHVTIFSRDERYTKPYEDLYKYALWLALALGGIGQATSRGFGKFSLRGPDGENVPQINVSRILERLRESKKLKGVLGDLSGCGKVEGDHLAMIPTFHEDVFKVKIVGNINFINISIRNRGKIGCVQCRGRCGDIWQVLQSIGNATLKNAWKACKEGRLRVKGGKYHTWPLGLPRMVGRPDRNARMIKIGDAPPIELSPHEKIPTGYLFEIIRNLKPSKNKYETGRIQSLIRFTPFSRDDRFGVIVYGFLTRDLDYMLKKLYHYGYKEARKKGGMGFLDINPVRSYAVNKDAGAIFDEALGYIESILGCDRRRCRICGGW